MMGILGHAYQVTLASDGREALDMARSDPPDLVLTDVMMPNLDGFQLLAALRESPPTAAVPVIMVSARAGEDGMVEGLEAGADDYLVKPFSARELMARVRANVELDRARRAEAEAHRQALSREHRIADELQASLLPALGYEHDHLEVATYYQAGVEGTYVGGDWYDVIELGAGRTALVIGDVMGRGVRAAAIMGQLRSAVRAYARLDLAPADVLELLDGLVRDLGEDQIVTCVYAVYDPADRGLTYANAGHLPPLLRDPGGGVTALSAPGGPPLGTGPFTLSEDRLTLAPDAVVTFYTDGLVEHRGLDLDAGIEQLRSALSGPPGDLALEPSRLVGALLADGPDDDIAVLMARVPEASGQSLVRSWTVAPERRAVHGARGSVSRTMAEWSMPTELTEAVVLVVSEMVTNAVIHGRPPIDLRLRRTARHVVVEVGDGASVMPRKLRPRPEDEHGRGLQLIAALSERWGSRPTPEGKSVWCLFVIPPA